MAKFLQARGFGANDVREKIPPTPLEVIAKLEAETGRTLGPLSRAIMQKNNPLISHRENCINTLASRSNTMENIWCHSCRRLHTADMTGRPIPVVLGDSFVVGLHKNSPEGCVPGDQYHTDFP